GYGFCYLKSYVEKYTSDWKIIIEREPEKLLSYNPDVIGISTVSETYPFVKNLARDLRGKGFKKTLVIGGSHISGFPESISDDFDIGVLGDGEQAFLEILKKVENSEMLNGIKNTIFQGKINERETPHS
ncbi:unnamed protein product, partial [marine sediment metagenome]